MPLPVLITTNPTRACGIPVGKAFDVPRELSAMCWYCPQPLSLSPAGRPAPAASPLVLVIDFTTSISRKFLAHHQPTHRRGPSTQAHASRRANSTPPCLPSQCTSSSSTDRSRSLGTRSCSPSSPASPPCSPGPSRDGTPSTAPSATRRRPAARARSAAPRASRQISAARRSRRRKSFTT